MLKWIREWWDGPAAPEPDPRPEAPAPADLPGTVRVKVTHDGGRCPTVVDADTGRAIPVFGIDWSWDIRERATRTPTLVLKTYHREFACEGRATTLKVCPRCKAEVDGEREALAALPPPASPPHWYGDLPGRTRAYDLGRLAAERGLSMNESPRDMADAPTMKAAWRLGWADHATRAGARGDVPDHWRDQES
jgi:hypothetical protein